MALQVTENQDKTPLASNLANRDPSPFPGGGLYGQHVDVIWQQLRNYAFNKNKPEWTDGKPALRVTYRVNFVTDFLQFLLDHAVFTVKRCRPEDAAGMFIALNMKRGLPVDSFTLFRNRVIEMSAEKSSAEQPAWVTATNNSASKGGSLADIKKSIQVWVIKRDQALVL